MSASGTGTAGASRTAISSDRLVADCRIGKGRATVVADADLLNVDALGDGANGNLAGITESLARLRE